MDNQAIMPLGTFHNLRGHNRSIEISMAAPSPELISRAQDEVTLVLRQRRGVKMGEPNNFEFFTNDVDDRDVQPPLAASSRAASFGVCLLSLLVGGIGILNIMLVSVTERTREIGIRKALGREAADHPGAVRHRGGALSLFGGVIGVALGSGSPSSGGGCWASPPRCRPGRWPCRWG